MALHRPLSRAAAIVVAAALATVASVASPGPTVDLRDDRVVATCTSDARDLVCRYRYLADGRPTAVALAIGDQTVNRTTHTPFASSGAVAAILLLVDTSNPARGATVRRSIELVGELTGRALPHHRIGLAHFDSDLYVSAPLGSAHPDVRRAAAALLADGTSSELYRNTVSAIRMMERYSADRRAIVTISAGVTDDTAYFPEDVVATARAADVMLIGLGIPESVDERPHLQSLRRLAEETVSPFVEAPAGTLPDAFAARPFASVDAGGVVRAPLDAHLRAALAHHPLSLSIVLSNGTRLDVSGSATVLSDVKPPAPDGAHPPAAPERRPVGAPPPPAGRDDATAPGVWPYGLAGGVLAILGGAAYVWSRRRPPPRDAEVARRVDRRAPRRPGSLPERDPGAIHEAVDEADEGRGAVADGTACGTIGYLAVSQPAAGSPVHHPVTRTAFRIGRASDNDLMLRDPSVSRHHAEIHLRRDGTFVVKDLESMNGVYVNDRRVRSSAPLQEGDRLELGDLSLTFTFRSPGRSGEETLILSERDLTEIDLDTSGKGAA